MNPLKIYFVLFVLLSFLFVSTSYSQNEVLNETSQEMNSIKQKKEIFLVCNRLKESRWLRAFTLESGRCKTYYSKEGYVQVVSSASYFASCEAVLSTVKKNIEEGGFKCSSQNLTQYIEIE